MRDKEEESRLDKNYTSLSRFNKLLVSKAKLTEHFRGHFSARNYLFYTNQLEFVNSEKFLLILPPDDLSDTNEVIPDAKKIVLSYPNSNMESV